MPDSEPTSLPPDEAIRQRRARRQQRTQAILRFLGLPGGVGVALAVHQLRSGQVGLAMLTGLASLGVVLMALFAKFVSELVNKVLDRIEIRLEETTDTLADWIVSQLESALVRLWWQITPQFRSAYYDSLRYSYSAYRTQRLKTPGSVTLDLASRPGWFVGQQCRVLPLCRSPQARASRQDRLPGLPGCGFLGVDCVALCPIVLLHYTLLSFLSSSRLARWRSLHGVHSNFWPFLRYPWTTYPSSKKPTI